MNANPLIIDFMLIHFFSNCSNPNNFNYFAKGSYAYILYKNIEIENEGEISIICFIM